MALFETQCTLALNCVLNFGASCRPNREVLLVFRRRSKSVSVRVGSCRVPHGLRSKHGVFGILTTIFNKYRTAPNAALGRTG